ncbi:hypothetical protein GOV13_00840 [Candidatus Pacearchaeota archaeon]|nr:hypothetical protein [Candidatus Pacearchaeota archaeon]
MNKKEIFKIISSSILPFVLVILGGLILEEKKIIGIISILTGFLFLYFTYYVHLIKINEDKINELEKSIKAKEEILNTLKEIVILKKVGKIK